MDIGQFAFNVGKSTRQQLDDEMKRRVTMDKLEKLARSNPEAIDGMLRPRTMPSLQSGPGLVRRPIGVGGKSFGGGGMDLSPAPGSPAYYGRNWGVSPLERYEADAGSRFGPSAYAPVENSNTPTDAAMQEAIRERLLGDLDASTAMQKALLAKNGNGYAAAPVAASAAPSDAKAKAKADAKLLALKSKIAGIESIDPYSRTASQQQALAASQYMLRELEKQAAPAMDAAPADNGGKAYVEDDSLGVSLAGNTPEMLKAIQMRFGATNPVTIPQDVIDRAPKTMLPSHGLGAALPTGMGAGTTSDGADRGMGAGVTNVRPIMPQLGFDKRGSAGEGVATKDAPGVAKEQTAAQRVAAQIDADIAAIKAKKKGEEKK